jgi:hypothetical protein
MLVNSKGFASLLQYARQVMRVQVAQLCALTTSEDREGEHAVCRVDHRVASRSV